MGIIATLFALFIATFVLVLQSLHEDMEKFTYNIEKDGGIKQIDSILLLYEYKSHISWSFHLFELLAILFIFFEFYNGMLLFFIGKMEYIQLLQFSFVSFLFFIILLAYIICISYFISYNMGLRSDIYSNLTGLSNNRKVSLCKRHREIIFYCIIILISLCFIIMFIIFYKDLFHLEVLLPI